MGYEPIIFDTASHKIKDFIIPSPKAVSFYNVDLMRDTIVRYIEENDMENAPNVSYRQLAVQQNIEYHQVANVNDPKFVSQIANDSQMLGGISARFLQIFGNDLIEVFNNKGFMWNLHSGLLEAYKGLQTIPRAVVNGEHTYGMSLHETAPKVDGGNIIHQIPLLLDREKIFNGEQTILELYKDTVPSGVSMVMNALGEFKKWGFVPSREQKASPNPFYKNPTEQEFNSYTESGIVYADPSKEMATLTEAFSEAKSLAAVGLQGVLGKSIADFTHAMQTNSGFVNKPDNDNQRFSSHMVQAL